MESRLFLIKNIKNEEKTKKMILEKTRTLVSSDATLQGNMIVVKKTTTWTDSEGTISFSKKDKDLEITMIAKHGATGVAIGTACVLLIFTLLLALIPWYFYDQDKKNFNDTMAQVLNYAVDQG